MNNDLKLVFVYPKNPQVFEIVKLNRSRQLALDNIKGESGKCKWCLGDTDNNRKKYCSTDCRDSAWAFFYPQRHGRKYLLERQDGKCAHCRYDFDLKEKKFKRKEKCYTGWNPELQKTEFTTIECEYVDYGDVDHVIPIQFGGEILGLENVQILCKDCHLVKTSSEARSKKTINTPIRNK